MRYHASLGFSENTNSREAGIQAAQRALKGLASSSTPSLAILFFSEGCDAPAVHAGVVNVLGDCPIWGAGATRLLAPGGNPRVLVACFAGSELKAHTLWLPQYTQDVNSAARQLKEWLNAIPGERGSILAAADGVQGDFWEMAASLGPSPNSMAGLMAAGSLVSGKTYQVSNQHCSTGGLSLLWLGPEVRLGIGMQHGCKDCGIDFRVSRSQDVWINRLDDYLPAEAYERVFGYPARQWAASPLNELIRMYPLGVQRSSEKEPILHAPLKVEIDGRFRMNIPVAEGQVVRLMPADPDACLAAARQAVRDALQALDGARPTIGMLLVDQGWQELFETRPGVAFETVQAELGRLPLFGAYTFGQIGRSAADAAVQAVNMNVLVVVFATRG